MLMGVGIVVENFAAGTEVEQYIEAGTELQGYQSAALEAVDAAEADDGTEAGVVGIEAVVVAGNVAVIVVGIDAGVVDGTEPGAVAGSYGSFDRKCVALFPGQIVGKVMGEVTESVRA
jgi:hypothetical protein